MSRPAVEVADIFRDHGAAWRRANRGHVSLGKLKAMSAIEGCRTAALGGHVARCENEACGHTPQGRDRAVHRRRLHALLTLMHLIEAQIFRLRLIWRAAEEEGEVFDVAEIVALRLFPREFK